MAQLSIWVAALSDVGRVRKNNEDAFTITDLATGRRLEGEEGPWRLFVGARGLLMALSDGMGGHEAGEVASALVLDALRAGLSADAGGDHEQAIAAAVVRANDEVTRTAQATGKHGMGATLTAVQIVGRDAMIGQVGDSRAYVLRAGQLRQLTRDQSLVQLLVDQGTLSPETARQSSHKNVLLQAIGTSPEVKGAISRLKLRSGDRFLLCCDGLSNAVGDTELRDLVADSDPDVACRKLIDLANLRGGGDNLTAIVACVEGGELEEPAPSETFADTFEVLRDFSPSLR